MYDITQDYSGASMNLANGCSWEIVAGDGTGSLLHDLAKIMELKPGVTNKKAKILILNRESDDGHAVLDSNRRNFPNRIVPSRVTAKAFRISIFQTIRISDNFKTSTWKAFFESFTRFISTCFGQEVCLCMQH